VNKNKVPWLKFNMTLVTINPLFIAGIVESYLAPNVGMNGLKVCREVFRAGADS
jgi:hypothetical protein